MKIDTSNNKYEYFLKYWGEIEIGKPIEKELNIHGNDFWFDNNQDRQKFKILLNQFAENKRKVIMFKETEGKVIRYKTIAKMNLIFDVKPYYIENDFGYGFQNTYEECTSLAEYMYYDGNYSCDCNKLLFLARRYKEFEHYENMKIECANNIKIENFRVEFIK